MKSDFFLPPELKELPLNVLMCYLIDYCKEKYNDAIINPIRDRWQADSKYYSPEAIIKELGGEDYLKAMKVVDSENMSRFLNSIFSIKGGRDSLKMMLAFIGIYGQVVDYHTYTRDSKFPGLIDPDLKPSIPVMNPCEVYVILEVDQDEVTGSGIEFDLFRKVVELFLWSCADLVAMLIIRKILDSTMPVIVDQWQDCSIFQEFGDSMVFNTPYYNSGRKHGDGTVAFPAIDAKSLVSIWPPFYAPWTPVQPSSDFLEDEVYGKVWVARPFSNARDENVGARIPFEIQKGDYVTLSVPIFIPDDSNATNFVISAVGGGAQAKQSVSIIKGEWQIIHLYDYTETTGEYFDVSFTITTNAPKLLGNILVGTPTLTCEHRLVHKLGEASSEIGMYDKLDLIQG